MEKNRLYKIFAALVCAMMVLPIVSASYDKTVSIALDHKTGTSNLQVVSMKYDPYPVGPGEYFEVWLKLGNEADQDIKDLTFELTPGYPFSIDASENATRHFGTLLANSMVLVKYKVRVDPGAVTGDTDLKYRYRSANSDFAWEEGIEMIKVQTREAMLDIKSVEAVPPKIEPGKEADVKIRMKNLGSSVIRDIDVILDLTMSTVARNPAGMTPTPTIMDSYYNAIPLVPVGSSAEKRVDYLNPGQEVEVVYHLSAYPDAKAKIYKVPLLVSYKDQLSKNYTKADIIGLTIGAEPDLSIFIVDNKIYGKGAAGSVSIKLVNKGATDVKFLNVMLKPSDDYDIISADTVYVGSLDSDDYETADFQLYVNGLGKDNTLNLPIEVSYKDSTGQDYKKDITLETKIYSLSQRGMASNNSLWIFIIVVLLMVGAWFGYKRWEKGRKKK